MWCFCQLTGQGSFQWLCNSPLLLTMLPCCAYIFLTRDCRKFRTICKILLRTGGCTISLRKTKGQPCSCPLVPSFLLEKLMTLVVLVHSMCTLRRGAI